MCRKPSVARILSTLLSATVMVAASKAATPLPPKEVEIAAAISLTGEMSAFGTGSREGIQLAIEDANRSGLDPRIQVKIYDDESSPETAAKIASQVVASRAVLVVGPSNTTTSLTAGPIFAQAAVGSIATTASSDLITDSATTYRVL